jgi:hypothetical protein
VYFFFLLTIIGVATSGCLPSRILTTLRSPDAQKEVGILEIKGFPDSTITITMKTASRQETLLADDSDRSPKQARIVWTGDSRIIVARIFCAGEDLIFAYDTLRQRKIQLPFLITKLGDEQDALELIRSPEEWGAATCDSVEIRKWSAANFSRDLAQRGCWLRRRRTRDPLMNGPGK